MVAGAGRFIQLESRSIKATFLHSMLLGEVHALGGTSSQTRKTFAIVKNLQLCSKKTTGAIHQQKGHTLRGIFDRRLWSTSEDFVKVLASGKVDISWIVSLRMPLTDFGYIVDFSTVKPTRSWSCPMPIRRNLNLRWPATHTPDRPVVPAPRSLLEPGHQSAGNVRS